MSKRIVVLTIMVAMIFASSVAVAGYYRTQLRTVTKKGSLYSFRNFDAKLIWRATFFSDKFRSAYERKHLEVHHMDDPLATARFIAEQEHRQALGWDFFVGFYTKKDYKHFSSEPDSFWKVHLTTESGERVKPVDIEIIPITPYEKAMFPHLNRWSKAFRVTFPKVELGKKFSLTLHSVAGKSVLNWKIKDRPPRRRKREHLSR